MSAPPSRGGNPNPARGRGGPPPRGAQKPRGAPTKIPSPGNGTEGPPQRGKPAQTQPPSRGGPSNQKPATPRTQNGNPPGPPSTAQQVRNVPANNPVTSPQPVKKPPVTTSVAEVIAPIPIATATSQTRTRIPLNVTVTQKPTNRVDQVVVHDEPLLSPRRDSDNSKTKPPPPSAMNRPLMQKNPNPKPGNQSQQRNSAKNTKEKTLLAADQRPASMKAQMGRNSSNNKNKKDNINNNSDSKNNNPDRNQGNNNSANNINGNAPNNLNNSGNKLPNNAASPNSSAPATSNTQSQSPASRLNIVSPTTSWNKSGSQNSSPTHTESPKTASPSVNAPSNLSNSGGTIVNIVPETSTTSEIVPPVNEPLTNSSSGVIQTPNNNSDTQKRTKMVPFLKRKEKEKNPAPVRKGKVKRGAQGAVTNAGSNEESTSVVDGVSEEAVWMEKPNDASTQVFGMPLSTAVERGPEECQMCHVPLVILRCGHIVRENMREQGVFRLSGSHGRIQYWKKRFDLGDDPDLSLESDINVLSGVFKLYLRELPESLLTSALLPQFEAALSLSEPQAQIHYLRHLLNQLPIPNYATLQWIAILLLNIIKYSEENLMNIENISLIFSPTLKCSVMVVQLILENFCEIFERLI